MSKKGLILSTSLRKGSNSETLAKEFAKGAKEAGHNPGDIQGNPALQEAYQLGKTL